MSIIGNWQSLNKKETMNGEEKDTKTEGSAAQTSGNSIPSIFLSYPYDLCKRSGMTWTCMFLSGWAGAETEEVILLKVLILQAICLYQKAVPHLVSQCKFDFNKLLKGNFLYLVHIYMLQIWCRGFFSSSFIHFLPLYPVRGRGFSPVIYLFFSLPPGIMSEKGIREEVPLVLQYQILQLALDLPAGKFSWFRVQVKKLHCLISISTPAFFLYCCVENVALHSALHQVCIIYFFLSFTGYCWHRLIIWRKVGILPPS